MKLENEDLWLAAIVLIALASIVVWVILDGGI
jgi:hypothetical protein